MKTFPWYKASLTILFGLILWNYFSGIPSVPFHPDESTQIYMSADAFASPEVLAFSPGQNSGDKWRYRLIDSPLSRTLMGWALNLRGLNPNPVDWDWSADWDINRQAGALPSNDTLLTARWAVAWFFPLTCLFLFLLAKKVGGESMAVIAVILFSTNALVLIHTRRAMAESVLLCAFTALAWLMVDVKKTPWFAAIAAGLAVNTKQTAFPLAGMAGLEMLFIPQVAKFRNRLLNTGIFVAVILVISCVLNPVYWRFPVDALNEGLRQRQDLSDRMRTDYHTSINPLEQTVILAAQTFVMPPASYDVLNYVEATRPSESTYLAQSQNTLFRGFIYGMVMLILTITGWIILWKQSGMSGSSNRLSFLIFSGIVLISILMLMFFTAAPFQRYYIILVPFFSVMQSAALLLVWNTLVGWIKKRDCHL
jgi:4-amino-4-deoxy-L-arabinose transferase-like glycosyltransferase